MTLVLERDEIQTGESLPAFRGGRRIDGFDVGRSIWIDGDFQITPGVTVERTLPDGTCDVSSLSTEASESPEQSRVVIGPEIRVSRPRRERRQFDVLQQWEGVVTDVEGETFFAKILDLTDFSQPAEFVELYVKDVPPADKELLRSGAIFYWIAGYETSKFGQIQRVSKIRFRRSPRWTQQSLDRIKRKADEEFRAMLADDQNGTAES